MLLFFFSETFMLILSGFRGESYIFYFTRVFGVLLGIRRSLVVDTYVLYTLHLHLRDFSLRPQILLTLLLAVGLSECMVMSLYSAYVICKQSTASHVFGQNFFSIFFSNPVLDF